METAKKRIRREYAPLVVSVAIACDTAYSPLMQVYNAASGEYEPNRQLSPTVIKPTITANAADGSWPAAKVNNRLVNIKWYVNGVDITTLSDWSGQYTIEMEGQIRGAISILKNLSPGSELSLQFGADLPDDRTGVIIPVKTDALVLSTIDKSDDAYSVSIGETQTIRYNPFLDKLLLYEYKVVHGLISASAAAEAAAYDGNQYKRTIPIQVYKGGQLLTGGYTVSLYKIAANLAEHPITPSDYEVLSVSPSGVVLDLRLIDKMDYLAKAFISGSEVASIQFSVQRLYPKFTCKPSNETGILPTQIERYDVAQVDSAGKSIECPGSIVKIVWKTDTANKTNMEHNEGESTVFDLRNTGIGDDYTSDWVDVYVEATQKPAHSVASDGSDILTDENGEILIFN